MTTSRWSWLIALGVIAVGCSKPPDPMPEAKRQLEAAQAAMCACKDKPCVEQVAVAVPVATKGLTPAQLATLEPVTTAITKCEQEASSAIAAAIIQLTKFRDRTCACKDLPCTMPISDEMMKWSETSAKTIGADVAMTDEQMAQFSKINEEMVGCASKLASTLLGPGDAGGSGRDGLYQMPSVAP